MKTKNLLGTIARTISGAIAVVLLTAPLASAAQFTFTDNASDHGVGMGWFGTTGYIVGERDGLPTLFTYSGGSYTATTLSGMDTVVGISADGRNIFGVNGLQGAVTSVGNLGSYTSIPFLFGQTASEPHGATIGANPLVVGFSGSGSFTWTASSGSQNFAPPIGQGSVRLTGVNANGSVFTGSSLGGGSDNAFIFQNGSYTFLNEMGGNHSWALSISPNGQYYGGYIDGQAALWGPNDIRLTLDGNPLMGQVDFVTDNGFAFGTTGSDGWVYDPRTGLTSLLDAWCANENGSPLGHHLTGVYGANWDGDTLHIGVEGSLGLFNAQIGAVPEPSTFALGLLGLASLAIFGKRSRRA